MKKLFSANVVISIVCVIVIIISSWQIFTILSSRHIAKQQYQKITTEFIKFNSDDNKNSDNKLKVGGNTPISVDFESLSSKYSNAVGWIYINEDISYPVMQGNDNDYYLTHLPNGEENSSGAIFADYRNSTVGEDDNYIIYGHNMKNNSMFGSLDNFKNSDYYVENNKCYLYTETKTYVYNIVAGFVTDSSSNVYNIEFYNDNEFSSLINDACSKSAFKSNYTYKTGDKFLTLSTCTNGSDNSRFVLLCVLN